jgi:hypothetical protein
VITVKLDVGKDNCLPKPEATCEIKKQ